MADIELVTFSELIDKLITIDIKLYMLLDRTTELDKKQNKTADDINEIVNLSGKNIRLVSERSKLKSAIDTKLNDAIKNGKSNILDEVKGYGK